MTAERFKGKSGKANNQGPSAHRRALCLIFLSLKSPGVTLCAGCAWFIGLLTIIALTLDVVRQQNMKPCLGRLLPY